MKRATVAIYFDETYFSNNQLTFIDDYYKAAYAKLIELLLLKNVNIIIANNAPVNYVPDFQFKSYWQARLEDNSVSFTRIDNTPLTFDLLFDKGRFPFPLDRKINPDKIARISRDKYLSYLFMPDFHAQSFLLTDKGQQDICFEAHKGSTIVLKELAGHGGKQVYVGPIEQYGHDLVFPMIAQQFIDTSDGFPGLATGHHDIRVALFNGSPVHGLVRQSAQNKLKSNFSEGGSVRALFVDEIPQELTTMTQEIDRRFNTKAPRFFSADWGFDKNTQSWKLFEVNSAPGLALRDIDGPASDEFTELLAKNIARSALDAAR